MITLIFGSVVAGVVLGLVLGRWAVWVGVGFVAVGLGQFAAVYVYQTYFFTRGDMSGLGMLTTLCVVTFVPLGLVVMVAGLLRGWAEG